jgi:hypothetical protein
MYDPTVGQWISEDPIEFDAGDSNLRRYVGNSPTNFVDPDGRRIVHVVEPGTTVTAAQRARVEQIIQDIADSDYLLVGALARAALSPAIRFTITWDSAASPFVMFRRERLGIHLNPTATYLAPGTNTVALGFPAGTAAGTIAMVVVAHELGHAMLDFRDPTPRSRTGSNVTLCEDPLRSALGLPPRGTYDGFPVPPLSAIPRGDIQRGETAREDYPHPNPFDPDSIAPPSVEPFVPLPFPPPGNAGGE